MPDLHLHTRHSDGALEVFDLLKIAEEVELEYISITDHNTVDAYEDLQKINVSDYFSGKIIGGIEIECMFNNWQIEVLGYGFDLNGLKNSAFMKKYYPLSMRKFHNKRLEIYKNVCRDLGIKFDEDLQVGKFIYANRALVDNVSIHPENAQILEKFGFTSNINFLEKHVFNRDSPFYAPYAPEFPSIFETVEVLKSLGGKIFLAHPFRYDGVDGKILVDEITVTGILDGFECLNKATTTEQTEYLIDHCTKHKLLKSGGSDFHRPTDIIGYGDKGKCPINMDLMGDWIGQFL